MQTLTDDIFALEESLNSTNSSSSTNISYPVFNQTEKDDVVNITVGDFRLADVEYIKGGYVRGRAEYFNSSWGTVCDDSFTNQNADVFCKSIGFTSYMSLWASNAQNYSS